MNRYIHKIHKVFTNPKVVGLWFIRVTCMLWPEKTFLSAKYYLHHGRRLDLTNPQTFSEKLQWLKLYNRKPVYTTMVDKYAVKEYIANKIGADYIIPTLGVWDSFDEIDFASLPEQFVLKTTHGGGGGGIVICKDKTGLDMRKAKTQLEQSLKVDIYKVLKEWPYKNVKKRIIAEKYLETPSGDLKDYKFFCFHGKVKFFKIDFGRFTEHHANYYSLECALLDFGETGFEPVPDYPLEIPQNLEEMIRIAEVLSCGVPFLRVDLYNADGKIYFGELTFFPASGMSPWKPIEADKAIGDLLDLTQVDN